MEGSQRTDSTRRWPFRSSSTSKRLVAPGGRFVTQLRSAYGAQLSSVVLYGSAAAGEHVPKKSDYNVVVLLGRIEPGALAKPCRSKSLAHRPALSARWRTE